MYIYIDMYVFMYECHHQTDFNEEYEEYTSLSLNICNGWVISKSIVI